MMKKRYLIPSIISVLFALIFLVIYLVSSFIVSKTPYQKLTKDWQGEGKTRYAYVSAYAPNGGGKTYEDLRYADLELQKKLTQAAISNENPNSSLYIYSYAAEKSENVTHNKQKSDATALYVGEEFFKFHPEELLFGNYFEGSSISKSNVVIDDILAWQLFGAMDVCGLEVTINSKLYKVCGVIKSPVGKYSNITYGSKPRIWIPYDYLAEEKLNLKITCIEYLLPNKIDNFALSTVESIVGFPKETSLITESSQRLKVPALIEKLKSINTWTIPKNNVTPMYWENELRITETKLSILLFFELMCVIIAIISVILLSVVMWQNRKWKFSEIREKIDDAYDKFKYRKRKRDKKHHEKTL